ERLAMPGAVGVEPPGAAVARRGTRHRSGLGAAAGVERGGAGNLLGGPPDPVDLVDNERLAVRAAVCVPPGGAAVARRGTGHRAGLRGAARVENPGAGNLLGDTPRPARGCRGASQGNDAQAPSQPSHNADPAETAVQYLRLHETPTSSAPLQKSGTEE